MTLFFHNSGPMLRYEQSMLKIHDLNPEINTQWRMSRWEMIKLGFRFLIAGACR
jgi:hypothetical protein